MEVILLVGAPGSGKSTYCSTHLKDYLRINQDDQGKVGHWDIYLKALQEKTPKIVIDRMNHLRAQREKFLSQATSNGYLIKIIQFKVSYDICFERILERKNHPTILDADIGRIALCNFFKYFEEINPNEANEIIEV